MKRFVILGAMPQEIAAYEELKNTQDDYELFVDFTGVGKSSAAAKTQSMIDTYRPDAIIFTGVAGSLHKDLTIGDLVIGDKCVDSELDVRSWNPEYKLGEQPFTKERIYNSDQGLVHILRSMKGKSLKEAYIASGSRFLDASGKKEFIDTTVPELTVEGTSVDRPNVYDMETSAVLQTANRNQVPCIAIRAISDNLKGDVSADFDKFVGDSVKAYKEIVTYILKNY